MKHIAVLIAVLGAFFAIPTSANADCARRIVSYTTCGRPIYAHYEVYGYDRCGNPVGRWVTDWFRCSCDVCNPRPVYQSPSWGGYGYRHGSGAGHYHSHDDCHGSGYRIGRFYFSFGR